MIDNVSGLGPIKPQKSKGIGEAQKSAAQDKTFQKTIATTQVLFP